MRNRSFCSRVCRAQAIDKRALLWFFVAAVGLLMCAPRLAIAGEAPPWMHSLTTISLPSYDERTDAVLVYSATDVTVQAADKIKTRVRRAYKILRPEGRTYGNVVVPFRPSSQRVTSLHGWSIPAQGKDFEVKEKDAVEVALPGVEGGELVVDVRAKILRIPAPDPGNIIGYEYVIEERPLVLQDLWHFQETIPVSESHYSVQLPPNWGFKESWLNYPAVKPVQKGSNEWEWVLTDIKGIQKEPEMPPLAAVTGEMVVSFFAAGGPSPQNGYADWRGMGNWYLNLVGDRVEPSEAIKQQVRMLTASKASPFEKMQAIADFLQHDIRYVGIELGIGGWQPHAAAEVFEHRYGDCKDKATLMRAMLRVLDIESYHIAINTKRGWIRPETPAHQGFNHVIVAVRLPEGVADSKLIATLQHPKLGRILFFDPTDQITPFGQIRGDLQANYGLLVAPDGGELVQLPPQSPDTNGIQRTAKFTLEPSGTLKGEVQELRVGDRAWSERWRLRTTATEKDRIKPIESLLAGSLANFRITSASSMNLQHTDQPFGFKYSFESASYAKNAGSLLLVRPRVLGVKSKDFLETKEARKFPIEFSGPVRDTDSFEITIPTGYVVDDVPVPVAMDYGFASYDSKTEADGNVIRYNRTFVIKELSVPVSRAEEVRKFYRTIANDERSTVVLKPTNQ